MMIAKLFFRKMFREIQTSIEYNISIDVDTDSTACFIEYIVSITIPHDKQYVGLCVENFFHRSRQVKATIFEGIIRVHHYVARCNHLNEAEAGIDHMINSFPNLTFVRTGADDTSIRSARDIVIKSQWTCSS